VATRRFSLVELLIVIAIGAVLMSLIMPVMKKTIFQTHNLKCVQNLKTQGVAYTLYCEDNNDDYPGISNDNPPKARYNVYEQWYNLGAALSPYFENGDKLKYTNEFAKYVKAFECPLGRKYQSFTDPNPQTTLNYRENKTYYFLFFNATQPLITTSDELTAYNNKQDQYQKDLNNPSRMHRLGDTWTFNRVDNDSRYEYKYGVTGLKFNILAMDGIHWIRSAGYFESNHFLDAPDLKPSSDWGGISFHRSTVGEMVANFVLDDGSTQTLLTTYGPMFAKGDTGWNAYRAQTIDNGALNWAVPRKLAVGGP